VEFFDYACGYCRQSVAVVDRLLAEDKGLRVVYREFPVLGPDSEAAARASLAAAAASPAKYNAFHHALFAAGRPEPATLARVAAAQGVTAAGTSDIAAELEGNAQLAAAIGVRGTPAFIVGEEVFPGAVTYETLKQAIADARAARK
jgi:protein-disulfide isomerase